MKASTMTLALAALLTPAGFAAEARPTTAPKAPALATTALEQTIHDYILQHPEVILESVRSFAERNQAAEKEKAQAQVRAHLPALHSDSPSVTTPGTGEPVTIVEFFDYRCGYCKKMAGAIAALTKKPGVRVVFKDLPILGPESVLAAQAALAAEKQNAYEKLQSALLATAAPITEEEIAKIATEAGLDVERLKKDMTSDDVKAALRRNAELAEKLGVRATPTFVVGQQLVSGAVEAEAFAALIEKARQEIKTPAVQPAAGGSH